MKDFANIGQTLVSGVLEAKAEEKMYSGVIKALKFIGIDVKSILEKWEKFCQEKILKEDINDPSVEP
jgi:hypothetical protein